ncbi:MAG: membrane protein insertase YidC, partial [Burkholderiales bacterium]
MTDMRRTLLWVVFSMSLFLIYDAWNKHNGQPSFFSPAPAKVAAPAAASAGGLPKPAGVAGAMASSATPGAAPGAAPVVAEKTVVTTDVVKATLSGEGGSLVRLELLKYPDQVIKEWYEPLLELVGARKPAPSTGKDVVLMDEAPDRLYLAESGLIPKDGGSGLPNHHTVMTLVPGERTLAAGQNALQVKFESPAVGGVKLVKTYTFKRGDYVIDVKNEVVNESGAAVSPRLYLQLVRDGVPPPGGSSVYSTFTGPSIDDGNKFQKVQFKDIEKRTPTDKSDHTIEGDSGWIAMVQHYFASAWLIDKDDGTKQPREYFTGKSDMTN